MFAICDFCQLTAAPWFLVLSDKPRPTPLLFPNHYHFCVALFVAVGVSVELIVS